MNLNSIRYDIPNAEDLCQCPYDDTHMVRAKRMPYHLVKCRMRFTGLNYVNCPFNARHEMPAPELRHHIMNCPDRVMVTQDITAATRSGNKGNLTIPLSNWQPLEANEDWEKDAPLFPTMGLDKGAWMKKKIMAKSTIGMTRAEKKKFYEILRVNFHREQEGLEPLELDLEADKPDSQLQDLLQKQIMSLRKPLNKPQILLAAEQRKKQPPGPTPIFNQSMMLAGIGRGKPVAPGSPTTKDVKLPRPVSGLGSWFSSSARSDITSETGTSDIRTAASSVEPGFQGIGRGLLGVGRGMMVSVPPGLMQSAASEVSTVSAIKGSETGDSMTEITDSVFEDASEVTETDDVSNNASTTEKNGPNTEGGAVENGKKKTSEEEEEEGGEEEEGEKEDKEERKEEGSVIDEDTVKLIKKFEKKLRGIQLLEEKFKEGFTLNSAEVDKISRKNEIGALITQLKSGH